MSDFTVVQAINPSNINLFEITEHYPQYAFLFYCPEYKNLVKELLLNNVADTKRLLSVCSLSRSATWSRLMYLTRKGLVLKKLKPGTEHWKTPRYEFSLAIYGEAKSELAKLLEVQEVVKAVRTNLPEYQSFEWSKVGEIMLEMAKRISFLKNKVTDLEAKAAKLNN